MNSKRFISRFTSVALSLALILAFLAITAFPNGQVYAAGNAPKNPTLSNKSDVEKFAQVVSQALVLEDGGTVTLKSIEGYTLNNEQRTLLDRLVKDINNKEIGIAVVNENKTVVYGNQKALDSSNHPVELDWADGFGVHVYFNSYWTGLLKNLQGWAVGVVAGLIVAALCSTGLGCIAAGVVVSFLWDWVIWPILRKYYPDSMTMHFSWWGQRYVQPWKSGKWYNGMWFYAGRWW